jgi:3-oxoacyl-[acyl-carrier-protein] synthase-3
MLDLILMFINSIAHYLPSKILDNNHFYVSCGITSEWIIERTGIYERRMCPENENTNTMAIQAVDKLLENLNSTHTDFDLIIGATYTPYDTVVTLAHAVQHHLQLHNIPVVSVSTACSSVLNALEIAEGYFAAGKATKALIVGSEHNTAYFNDTDKVSGPLWGDAAVAFSVSNHRQFETDLEIKHLNTGGGATRGKAIEAVYLRPWEGVFPMPHGRDVFIHACEYMYDQSIKTLQKFNLTINDIDFFIPHQANLRISKRVAEELQLPSYKLVVNTHKYGNTGCCGFGIGFSETLSQIKKGNRILVSVFGGGYSYGTMLLEA